jgi:hypothetical protein
LDALEPRPKACAAGVPGRIRIGAARFAQIIAFGRRRTDELCAQQENDMANLILCTAIVVGVWAWHQQDFRTPRFVRHARLSFRRLTDLAGWLIVGTSLLYLIGDVIGGYTTRNLDQGQHVHRSHDPLSFWLQLTLQLVVYAGTGIFVIACARSRGRSEVARA